MSQFSTALSQLSRALDIKWAPINIPIRRRLQTLAAFGYIFFVVLLGQTLGAGVFIKLLYSWLWWLALLYWIWMVNDNDIRNRGGRSIEWVRNCVFWRYYCNYFPIKLVKTVDLDPSRNYLFACYPHGVITLGAFGTFSTKYGNFDKLLPGMSSHMTTLGANFLIPFFRDFILALGFCSSSEESLLYLLDEKKYQGNCACIIVGGAAEMIVSHPKEYTLVLSRRKGFVRVAIKSGAPLVPVFTFGETDLFAPPDNPENSMLRQFQEKFKQLTGLAPILTYGRGFFQYSFGLIPFRVPLTVVVGAPIEVKKNLEPTSEEIDAVHAEFTKRLVTLFETEKAKYVKNPEVAHPVIT